MSTASRHMKDIVVMKGRDTKPQYHKACENNFSSTDKIKPIEQVKYESNKIKTLSHKRRARNKN